MSVKILVEEKRTVVLLSGELDHHNAKDIRSEIDFSLRENQPEELVLDFADVGFMDSSGIGLVMGRYKLMQELNGKVVVKNPPKHIRKVMRLSGIDRLAQIITNEEVYKK